MKNVLGGLRVQGIKFRSLVCKASTLQEWFLSMKTKPGVSHEQLSWCDQETKQINLPPNPPSLQMSTFKQITKPATKENKFYPGPSGKILRRSFTVSKDEIKTNFKLLRSLIGMKLWKKFYLWAEMNVWGPITNKLLYRTSF